MSRGVEPAEAALELAGPGEGLLHGHLLVEREPDEERERVAGEERVRLVVVGEVEPVGRGRHRSLPFCPVDACARETHLPPLMA